MRPITPASPKDKRTRDRNHSTARLAIFDSGGGEGILPIDPKKFPVAMVRLKSFRVNERILEKSFCQCHWEI